LFSFISDYDDRLAAAEQIFWQSKIPQMYLWKLRHLQSKCKLEKLYRSECTMTNLTLKPRPFKALNDLLPKPLPKARFFQ
jgi:hypothetical protein